MDFKYSPILKDKLKYQFKNLDRLTTNYGDLWQDMFVLSILDGKENGTYLEIGAAEPYWLSNTVILEKEFGWKGISLELDHGKVDFFNRERTNPCFCGNALIVDYQNMINRSGLGSVIDYLSVDIEPPENTFAALKSIPHDKLKFRVITFEHDLYTGGEAPRVREESRKFLTDLGYHMVVNDVAATNRSVEDWYVMPNLVDMSIVNMFQSNKDLNNFDEYMIL